jgi:hypothetical protein
MHHHLAKLIQLENIYLLVSKQLFSTIEVWILDPSDAALAFAAGAYFTRASLVPRDLVPLIIQG